MSHRAKDLNQRLEGMTIKIQAPETTMITRESIIEVIEETDAKMEIVTEDTGTIEVVANMTIIMRDLRGKKEKRGLSIQILISGSIT